MSGRTFASEKAALQGLLLAQQAARSGTRPVHVVLANAGAGGQYAQRVVAALLQHRRDLGARPVVIGALASRVNILNAAQQVIAAGIPYVAPTANGETVPGRPLLDRPGYLQLRRPVSDYAEAALQWLGQQLAGGRVTVYTEDDPNDLYTSTLTRDLGAGAARHGLSLSIARDLRDVTAARLCPSAGGTKAGVFYAGRSSEFLPFARAIDDLNRSGGPCGAGGKVLVLTDDDIAPLMEDDAWRRTSGIDGPLAYVPAGTHCSELLDRAGIHQAAVDLLELARQNLDGACAAGGAQLAPSLVSTYDAAQLVQALYQGGNAVGALSTPPRTVALAEGPVTVAGGQVVQGLPVPAPVCVVSVANVSAGSRSSFLCPSVVAAVPSSPARP